MYKVHTHGYASGATRNSCFSGLAEDFCNPWKQTGSTGARSTARTPTLVATCITAHFIYDTARLANKLKNKAL